MGYCSRKLRSIEPTVCTVAGGTYHQWEIRITAVTTGWSRAIICV